MMQARRNSRSVMLRAWNSGVFALLVVFLIWLCPGLRPNLASAQQVKAQSAAPPQVVINQVEVSNFPGVILYVSVLDSGGKLIPGLGAQDFSVTEDEVEQSPVRVETQLPSVASVLVVDSSGSMKNAMQDTQRAAATYIDNVRGEDEVSVIDFSDKVKVAQGFTTDKQALRNTIRGIRARGNTALYDAIFEAAQTFGEREGRKVIIVLTDGKDDDGMNKPLSLKTVDEVIAAANEVNVPVFTIGLGKNVDETVLGKIARETGGRFFLSPDSADLEGLYKQIGAQLEGQYVLNYTTNLAEADGSWHRIVVGVQESFGQKQYKAPLAKKTVAAPAQTPPNEEKQPAAAAESRAEINVLAASQGAKVIYVSSQYNSKQWAAQNLIDEAIGENHGYASSGSAQGPQEVLFELPKPALISQIIVDPYTNESEKNWAKDCELAVNTIDPHGEYTKVLEFTLDNTRIESQDPAYSLTEQTFSFEPTRARWVRLILKSNYGGSYIELGEVKLMGAFTEAAASQKTLKNVLAADNGGKVVYYTTQYNDNSWAARNLIDGNLGQGYEYATRANQVAEVVFVLPKAVKITRLSFNPFTTESPDNWAREVEVEVSTSGPKQGFKSVGKFTLHNRQGVDPNTPLPPQNFDIEPAEAKFIKLRLLSNHGGAYIELGEFEAFAPEQ